MRPTDRRLLFPILALCACGHPVPRADAPHTDAPAVVRRSIQAMGGEAVLRGLHSIGLEGFREQMLPAIADDPELPGILAGPFTEVRDVDSGVARRTFELRMVQRPDAVRSTADIRIASAPADAAEELALAPERLLLLALDAPDLRARPDTVIAGRRHHVVVFGTPAVHLRIDAGSGLPREWSTVRAYPDDRLTWAPWGEVETRVLLGAWSLEAGGLRYPRMQRLFRNGAPYRMVGVTRIEVNPPLPADLTSAAAPPPSSAAQVLRLGEGVRAVADGIVFIPGPFNSVLVRQADGVVVIEAPESAAYSRLVLDEAERRFPGQPIKAVVATSSVWPHIAGLEAYRERGVPVLATSQAARVLEAIGRRESADGARPADPATGPMRTVDDTMTIGDGQNAIVLFRPRALGSSAGPGELLAYLPGPRLLYAADLYIPRRFEPNLWSQKLSSLVAAVSERAFRPDRLIALHVEPLPWATVLAEADSLASGAR